jgi:hypothetical protein
MGSIASGRALLHPLAEGKASNDDQESAAPHQSEGRQDMNISQELFEHYARFVSYARGLGVPRDSVEDVVQEAFLRVLKVDFEPVHKGMDLALIFQNIRWSARTLFAGRNESDIDAAPDVDDQDMETGVSFLPGYCYGGVSGSVYRRPTEFLAEVDLALSTLSDIDRHFYLSAIFNLSKNQALDMLPFVFTNCDADIKQISITKGEIKRLRDCASTVDFVEIRRRLHYLRGKWDESLSVYGVCHDKRAA